MATTRSRGGEATVRIALLGAYTLDILPNAMKPFLVGHGLVPEFYVSGFNQYRQEVLNDSSPFFAFAPDFAILSLDERALFSEPFEQPLSYRSDAIGSLVAEGISHVASLVDRIGISLPKSTVLLTNLAMPATSALGLLEGNSQYSLKRIVREYNAGVERLALPNPRLYIVDYESLVARFGATRWYDERMWYVAKIPMGGEAVGALAKLLTSYIKAVRGIGRKCLVLDLDNTLWGGIASEEGLGGITIGQDGLGKAFLDFQREVLNLYERGVVLAISSKNNLDDALEVIHGHPDMILREQHFASIKIDWRDKVTHLREIADELKLGLDSFVFIDDSPVEREWVRSQLPEVLVVDLPEDPSFYRRSILDLEVFNTLALTNEDRRRAHLYKQEARRGRLREASSSLEEFYFSLQMQATITPGDPFTVPRITTLIQRTNQFNLTTRRYAQADIKTFCESEDYEVYSLQLRDKFGDNGIVGAAIINRQQRDVWKIDSFLLSCRVIGRTLETAFLGYIAERAASDGAQTLIGEYLPTSKNAPVRDFLANHGFEPQHEESNLYRLDPRRQPITIPPWIELS